MKKQHLFYGALIVVLTVLIGSTSISNVRAENDDTTTSGNSGQSPRRDNPPFQGQKVIPPALRKNIENNEDMRNKQQKDMRLSSTTRMDLNGLKKDLQYMGSTTRDARKDIRMEGKEDRKDIREEARFDRKNASSSTERREIRREATRELFAVRRDTLVKQLELSISNLKQIRERIQARITKSEEEGTSMTEAKALLVTADAKIVAANTSIAALKNFTPPAKPAANASSTEAVNLDKPREVFGQSVKAVNEARKALGDTIKSIKKTLESKRGTATSTSATN
jgi:hypothetical protein